MSIPFSKIFKKQNKDERRRKEEIEIRLGSIQAEVSEILSRRGATIFEVADILFNLTNSNNQQLGLLFNSLNKKIRETEEKLKKYENDREQSNENKG